MLILYPLFSPAAAWSCVNPTENSGTGFKVVAMSKAAAKPIANTPLAGVVFDNSFSRQLKLATSWAATGYCKSTKYFDNSYV
jgi:hypothetical protein